MIKSWTHFHGAPGASGEKVRPRCDDLSDKQADEEQHWFSKCGPQASSSTWQLSRKANPRGLPDPPHQKLWEGLWQPVY